MPQLLALEWNGCEARVAIASKSAEQTVIEQAFSIPLETTEPADNQPANDVGQQIATALRERGIGHCETIVGISRESVELRQLHIPAASDEELPQIVHLQALREFNELDDTWSLDFVPIGERSEGFYTVLAAAVSPELIDRAREVCRHSGLKMRKLVMRSYATAALLARAPGSRPTETQLIIELFSDHADLTVSAGGKLLLIRTMMFNKEQPIAKNLLSHIRLTIATLENKFGGRKIARIVICNGSDATDDALAEQIGKETSIQTDSFDPFIGLELGSQLLEQLPQRRGRFAAVLGMLLAESEEAAATIDFLNPRSPAESPTKRKPWKLIAVAAVLIVLAYLAYGRISYWQLQYEVDQYEVRLAEADKVLNSAGNKNLEAVDEISKWTDTQIICLDRLMGLSKELPPAKQIYITHLTLTPATTFRGGQTSGKMQMEGRAADIQAFTKMENALRARGLRVEGSKTSEDRAVPPYKQKFSAAVLVDR